LDTTIKAAALLFDETGAAKAYKENEPISRELMGKLGVELFLIEEINADKHEYEVTLP
jgi:hypothetical protein